LASIVFMLAKSLYHVNCQLYYPQNMEGKEQ
jgi:hypothetical protein